MIIAKHDGGRIVRGVHEAVCREEARASYLVGGHCCRACNLPQGGRKFPVVRHGILGERLADVRAQLEKDVRYANITIIEGHEASQYGIGIVSARIAEIVLRNEHAAIPIGSYRRAFGVTLSLPSVVGRHGVASVLEPELTAEERAGREQVPECCGWP